MLLSPRASSSPVPSCFSFTPSGQWDGNDGSWSTFYVNVGDNGDGKSGQDFRVLISTAESTTWIPTQANWCTFPDADTCAQARGVEPFKGKNSLGFQMAASSSWEFMAIGSLNLTSKVVYGFNNITRNGQFGYDTLGLLRDSVNSPMTRFQIIVGIETPDFFMGSLGLSNTPVKLGDSPTKAFIETFYNYNNTPSYSYSYTAGARYRLGYRGVFGSLVLGGYDRSRFTSGKSIQMIGNGNSSLVVGVQGITIRPDPSVNTNVFSATSGGFLAQIDSTLPYLWLPQSVCDTFADKFNLSYDNNTQLYIISDEAHEQNTNTNATISFFIGSEAAKSNDYTTINLPYQAFVQPANKPIYENETRYFPIRRSPNNRFVLGRTFLQEAYIIVDYERANFTIAQANFSDPMPDEFIVPIFSKSRQPIEEPVSSSSGLSKGAIAGIAIGIVVLALATASMAFFLYRRRCRERPPSGAESDESGDIKGHMRRASELEDPSSSPPPRSAIGYFSPDDIMGPMEMESPPLGQVEMAKSDAYFLLKNQQQEQNNVAELQGDYHYVEVADGTQNSPIENTGGDNQKNDLHAEAIVESAEHESRQVEPQEATETERRRSEEIQLSTAEK